MAKKKTKNKKAASSSLQAKTRELREKFHAAKLRLTRQRAAIYSELASRGDHPDVDHLFKAVRPIVPKISLFTVYRTMNVMEAAGLICRVTTWKSHARYGADLDSNAHFLCETCGRLENVKAGNLGSLRAAVQKSHGTVARADVIFRGIGKCCAARTKVAPATRYRS